jgi:hypothetical protein
MPSKFTQPVWLSELWEIADSSPTIDLPEMQIAVKELIGVG